MVDLEGACGGDGLVPEADGSGGGFVRGMGEGGPKASSGERADGSRLVPERAGSSCAAAAASSLKGGDGHRSLFQERDVSSRGRATGGGGRNR